VFCDNVLKNVNSKKKYMLVLFDIDIIAMPFVLAKTQEHSLVLRSFIQCSRYK